MKNKITSFLALQLLIVTASAQTKWSETNKGEFSIVKNPNGQTLGYSPNSGSEDSHS